MAAREAYSRRGRAGPCLGPADESSSARCLARDVARRSRAPYLRRWALIIALGVRPCGLEKLARVAARCLGHPLAAEHARVLRDPARLVEGGDGGPRGA